MDETARFERLWERVRVAHQRSVRAHERAAEREIAAVARRNAQKLRAPGQGPLHLEHVPPFRLPTSETADVSEGRAQAET